MANNNKLAKLCTQSAMTVAVYLYFYLFKLPSDAADVTNVFATRTYQAKSHCSGKFVKIFDEINI